MRILESTIEGVVANIAKKKLGVHSIKLNVVGSRGWPDRLFLIPGGKPLFIEFKRPGGKTRKLQDHTHQIMRNLGYEVEVHDNKEDAIEAIRQKLASAQVPAQGG